MSAARGSLLRLWLCVAGICAGAALGAEQRISTTGAAGVALFGIACAATRRSPLVLLAGLAACGFGTGALSAGLRADDGIDLERIAVTVPRCEVRGRVLEQMGGLGTLVAVDLVSCDGGRSWVNAGAAALDDEAVSGSTFRASGWLLPLGEDRFDRARYRAGARAELAAREITFGPPDGVFSVAASIRAGLRDSAAALAPPEAGLLRGLTIGDTEGISDTTLHEFRRTGLSHLLAVSGSNVSIVLAGIALLANRWSLRLRSSLAAAGLALFVATVGPDASVLRAAAMGAVALFAMALGRPTEPLHVLGVALAVLVALRPQIVFSVGLHLSVAATIGIVLWASSLQQGLRPVPGWIGLPLAVTLSAQAAVLPLLAGVFGEASLVAPATNLLAAPAVAPATILGFVGGLVGTVHQDLGGLVLRLAEPFASWILWVARLGAQPSWAAVAVGGWVPWVLTVAVVAAAAVTLARYGEPITLEG